MTPAPKPDLAERIHERLFGKMSEAYDWQRNLIRAELTVDAAARDAQLREVEQAVEKIVKTPAFGECSLAVNTTATHALAALRALRSGGKAT